MRIDRYTDHLYQTGAADRTVAEYVKWIRRLGQWAHTNRLDVDTLGPHHIRAWAATLPGSWSSRKQAKTSLKHYYRMIGRVADEPWESVKVPRKPRPRYRGLEPAQAGMVRDAALLAGGRPGIATLAGLYTAARASEIAVLRWDGITDESIRWWRSKTSEWHEVPLHPTLAGALDAFRPPRAEGYLFAGDRGRPHVTAQTIWEWVRDIGQLAGVSVGPHQLRATAINRALEVTCDIDAAAELAGHRDVSVTRSHYTRTSQRRLRAAVDALDHLAEDAP